MSQIYPVGDLKAQIPIEKGNVYGDNDGSIVRNVCNKNRKKDKRESQVTITFRFLIHWAHVILLLLLGT
jgi:hypothetical protein